MILVGISRDSSVSTAMDYGLGDRGLIPDRGKGCFSTSKGPTGSLRPPSLLSNGHRDSFLKDKEAGV
jgi:hypothetical protein